MSHRERENKRWSPTPSDFERVTKAYKMVLKEDWKGFKEFCGKITDVSLLSTPLQASGDNAFHIVAASGKHRLLNYLLEKIPSMESKLEVLMATDGNKNTVLHEVAKTDCVEAAADLVEILKGSAKVEERTLMIRNSLGETPLYRAAAFGKTKMVRYLAAEIEKVGNLREHFNRDFDKITILHIAVIGQHFDTAIWLLNKEKILAGEKENNGMTCLHLLALMPSAFRSTSPMGILTRLVYSCLPMLPHEDNDENDNHTEDLETGISQGKKQTAISKMRIAFWTRVTRGWPMIEKIWKEKQKHGKALELVKLLVKQDTSWKNKYDEKITAISLGLGKGGKRGNEISILNEKSITSTEETSPATVIPLVFAASNGKIEISILNEKSITSTEETSPATVIPLVFAASNGIIEIFDETVNQIPQALDYVSDKGQNILHKAILFRQEKIFERIEKMEILVAKLASRIDSNGNTILHHVADMEFRRGGTRSGPVLQFQEELQWFERVKQLMPTHYAMHRNSTRKITANDLFEETHKEQLKNAQLWIKDTSTSCSTVAILVATVVFAAAFTVPGGSLNDGTPVFLHSPLFMLFAVMDVASLASSLSSVVMFLSILTSPFEQADFLHSLPTKLMFGFTFLFVSVLTSVIAFMATILLIIRLHKQWTLPLIYVGAFIPVVVFAVMQLPLFAAFMGNLLDLCKEFKKVLPGKRCIE